MGHEWQDGTAIYYILRNSNYTNHLFAYLIFMNAPLVTLITYSTMVFEMGFVYLMWVPQSRYLLYAGAVLLHGGIAIMMGLPMFSMSMLVVDLIIFSDGQMFRISTTARSVADRLVLTRAAASPRTM